MGDWWKRWGVCGLDLWVPCLEAKASICQFIVGGSNIFIYSRIYLSLRYHTRLLNAIVPIISSRGFMCEFTELAFVWVHLKVGCFASFSFHWRLNLSFFFRSIFFFFFIVKFKWAHYKLSDMLEPSLARKWGV